ncbi:hypothetical protein Dimus_028118 [Dionaea muscipula]
MEAVARVLPLHTQPEMLSSSSSRTFSSIQPVLGRTISIVSTATKTRALKTISKSISSIRIRASVEPLIRQTTSTPSESEGCGGGGGKTTVILNSLRVLEWDKLCDVVSSFAGTSLGRQATKEHLWWSLDQTYEGSLRLLEETSAAIEIHKYGDGIINFGGIDDQLVTSAIGHARDGFPVNGKEAMAIAALLQFADALQINIKTAMKENADMNRRFMPLADLIMEWVTNRSLAKLIFQLINEDGSVKDSASPKLKQARARVQELERRLYQLMVKLVSNEQSNGMPLEVSNVDGRWCIKASNEQLTRFDGLLLTSGSDVGSSVEPLSAVPLNDELQLAKALVADAEAEVLKELTAKMQLDLDDMENLLNNIIQLDMVNARATYSLSFGGTCPDLLLVEDKSDHSKAEGQSSYTTRTEWKLYLPKAHHPLLLQQHRFSLQKAKKDVANATAEIRRRRLREGYTSQKEESDIDLPELQLKVRELEDACPVPVDFFVSKETRVLLITGPNTGGKTICLKTVGLAAMMAKSGLYVLCSEPARIPWFDFVFADIGDEQSLSQSLSTFSGHLKQISDIRVKSTSQSLVLLDEIGAGTNPLEGAALGMSVLESFADAGALLTMATTHHGELKTLKYSNQGFENACMEFDDVNLKPTYKILWGVPGRSNAINIAERLGLPKEIVDNARELYGSASTEINEVILDMERFKQHVQEHIHEAEHFLKLSKDLHGKLLVTERKLIEHGSSLRNRKWQQISEIASAARSIIHKKLREHRASVVKPLQPVREEGNSQPTAVVHSQYSGKNDSAHPAAVKGVREPSSGNETAEKVLKVGDIVHVGSLGRKATVIEVKQSRDEVVVQAGILKLKLKTSDVKI